MIPTSASPPDPARTSAARLGVVQTALVILTVLAAGFTLWALREILAPFALAVFLMLVIDTVARSLTERIPNFPERAALPVALVVIVALFAVSIWIIAHNANHFVAEAPTYGARLNHTIAHYAQSFGLPAPGSLGEIVHRLDPGKFIGVAAGAARNIGESAVFVLIYLGFLVASRQGFRRKAQALFTDDARQAEAARVIERLRRGVESYIGVQTLVGLVIAGLSAVVMWAMGLPDVMFWAFLIFLTNYVPAVGAAVGVLFPPLFGLLVFDEVWRPVVLLIGLQAVHFAVTHVLQPRLQGKSLNLDPIVLLLALAFWSKLWGLTGAFLSTPLTVAMMALLTEFPASRPLAVLMSSDGRPFDVRK